MAGKRLTNIDLIDACDSFPDPVKDPAGYSRLMDSLYTLTWPDSEGPLAIGYMPKWVLEKLLVTPAEVRGAMEVDEAARTVTLFHEAQTEAERTALAARLTAHWRAQKTFKTLDGWRNELFPVYGRRGELLLSIERAAMGLFGNMRYGVHMTAFTPVSADDASAGSSSTAHPFRIWVSKRAATKQTYPGMLDNTVAGGLMTDELSPLDCMVREADEEASLPEELMRGPSGARNVGTVTYIHITDGPRSGGESGLIYPECQWVFDLELPRGVVPRPRDGEVESFQLCTVEEVYEQLAQGLWKPNCALVVIDFFVRHGLLTPDNEPNYDEIQRRMHRRMPFPGPHQV